MSDDVPWGGAFNPALTSLSLEDVDAVAAAVLRHRIILNFDAHADGQTPDSILTAIIRGVAEHASAA